MKMTLLSLIAVLGLGLGTLVVQADNTAKQPSTQPTAQTQTGGCCKVATSEDAKSEETAKSCCTKTEEKKETTSCGSKCG